MKYLFAFIIILFFFSCENRAGKESNTEISNFDKVAKLDSLASISDTTIHSIFLDYEFGMTKSQFDAHTRKLQRQGKLKLDYLDRYYYVFDGRFKHEANIAAQFYKGKLFKFSLNVDDMGVVAFSDIGELLENKYGYPNMSFKPIEDEEGMFTRIWYINNLKIESGVFSGYFSLDYIDMQMALQYESDEELKKIQKQKEAVQDI